MTSTIDPLVSVVIPAYNAAWCVGRAIDSVLAQTFADHELIVVNDGSTDGTAQVLAGYGDRICVIDQPNGGMSHARNAGIGAARGRYVAFLDSDDRWLPAKLARQVAAMEAQPALAFCAATATLEDPEGKVVGSWACSRQPVAGTAEILAHHATVAGGASSVVAQTALVRQLGGFDETLFGAEDTDLWVRLASLGGFACIDEPLVLVLKRPGSVSGNRERMRAGAISMTLKNRPLLPARLQGAFWRSLYAGTLCDYAKWAYREGERGAAFRDLASALRLAPVARGRLVASLALAMLMGRRL